MILGTHYILTFIHKDYDFLNDLFILNELLRKICDKAKLNILSTSKHQFNPHGCTLTYMLSESHLTIHTWPEHNAATLDLFTCGSAENALQGIKQFIKEIDPVYYDMKKMTCHILPGSYPAIVGTPCEIDSKLLQTNFKSRDLIEE